ncbi:dopamine receptor 1 [Lingula anatina]|uniref:Dopamine receptor 1 n=1 Tax=Lingula anatina TaxID=7574 RepID=A0A1S3KAJ1_LINAN|nr:dopamine receptor 1 [Lingula anatina]|eukprot:XP_013419281.1 dopamine receptor 1 [Lingula anatina]
MLYNCSNSRVNLTKYLPDGGNCTQQSLLLHLGNYSEGITWNFTENITQNGSAGQIADLPSTVYGLGLSIFIGFILCILIFMSIAGNVLVCVAIYTDRNLRKRSNLLLVSLAVADLFVAVFVMICAVGNDLMGYWIFDIHYCNIWVSMDVMCCTASILNLCAISFDRYLHIRDPLKYARTMTANKIISMIVAVWILSALISFLPVNLGWHQIGLIGIEEAEEELPTERPFCALVISPVYAVISSCVSFYLPCIIMVTIYLRLYTFARHHVSNIKRTTTFDQFNGDSTNGGGGRGGSGKSGSGYKVSDHKAAITLGVIMGVFLLCWMPFFTINIVQAYCRCISPVIFSFLTWVGYVNSLLNPIIYSIFNKDFRNAFKKLLYLDKLKCPCAHENGDNSKTSNSHTKSSAIKKIKLRLFHKKEPNHNGSILHNVSSYSIETRQATVTATLLDDTAKSEFSDVLTAL